MAKSTRPTWDTTDDWNTTRDGIEIRDDEIGIDFPPWANKDGLVAYWSFDNITDSDTTVVDEVGGFEATLEGTSVHEQTTLESTEQYIETPENGWVELPDTGYNNAEFFTFFTWVRIYGSYSGYLAFVDAAPPFDDWGTSGWLWQNNANSTDHEEIRTRGSTNQYETYSPPAPRDEWLGFAVVGDGTATTHLYIWDTAGNLIRNVTEGTDRTAQSDLARLGYGGGDTGGTHTEFDSAQIYDHAKTQTQIEDEILSEYIVM